MSHIRRSPPSIPRIGGIALILLAGVPALVFGFPEMSHGTSQASFVLESFAGCFALASAVMCLLR